MKTEDIIPEARHLYEEGGTDALKAASVPPPIVAAPNGYCYRCSEPLNENGECSARLH